MQEPTRPHVGENLGKTGVLGKRGRVACPGISRLGKLALPAILKNDRGKLRKQGPFPQMPLVFHQKALVFHSLPLWDGLVSASYSWVVP